MHVSNSNPKPIKTYRIRDLKTGLYQIHETGGHAFEGTLQHTLAVALAWKLDEEDVIQALMEMTDNGHDYAEFGTMGRLIFTAADKKYRNAA